MLFLSKYYAHFIPVKDKSSRLYFVVRATRLALLERKALDRCARQPIVPNLSLTMPKRSRTLMFPGFTASFHTSKTLCIKLYINNTVN
jgi:hypothetical protein